MLYRFPTPGLLCTINMSHHKVLYVRGGQSAASGHERKCKLLIVNQAEDPFLSFFSAAPALGVSVKSVHLVAGRLGFYSQSGHTKDFKNSIRSFRARRSAQAEVRRVLCMCCSSCYVP